MPKPVGSRWTQPPPKPPAEPQAGPKAIDVVWSHWIKPGAPGATWPAEQLVNRMWTMPAMRYALDIAAGRAQPGVADVWYNRGQAVAILLPINKPTKREVQASLIALRAKVATWDVQLRINAWGWPAPKGLRSMVDNVMPIDSFVWQEVQPW